MRLWLWHSLIINVIGLLFTGETEFNTQTAVIMQETLKGLACGIVLLCTEGTLKSAWAIPAEALKTAVPALLYLGQNNLQYIAVGLLDAATYTVTYQTKTVWSGIYYLKLTGHDSGWLEITSGIFSVLLMGKVLQLKSWAGLLMLSMGVGVVQLSNVSKAKQSASSTEASDQIQGFMVSNQCCGFLIFSVFF